MRHAIGKPDGDIYYDDVNELSVLPAAWSDISDLTGILCLTHLTELDLYNNSISDITALSGLTSLIVIVLHHNLIVDLVANEGIGEDDVLYINFNLLDCGDPSTQDNLLTLARRRILIHHDC